MESRGKDAPPRAAGYLELEDGSRFAGAVFGAIQPGAGEVVFNTGMVGYVESLTDPSYRGQILTLTYPLIGNYGVPDDADGGARFESDRIQVRGLVVADYIAAYSHWEARRSLGDWLADQGVVGLTGVDTREITRILRDRGTMLGRIVVTPAGSGDAGRVASGAAEPGAFSVPDPNATDLVAEVTCAAVTREPAEREAAAPGATGPAPGAVAPHIVVVDCGCKRSIVRELRERGCRLTIVPYTHDFSAMEADGILLSNGPGDPVMCAATIAHVTKALTAPSGRSGRATPIAGICLGNQILALAAGARTYKLPFGHRGQNQPVQEVGSERCYITSQNHGYAVDGDTLPDGWEVWFRNLNDGTVEGIRHVERPFFAVQFHPEGSPGPLDSLDFFDRFVEAARHA